MNRLFYTSRELNKRNLESKPDKSPIIEGLSVVLILVAFVAVCITTTLALQPVWLDEVTVADPAVNLYFGKGFTSTGWQYQTKDEFWASNAPLHQILLYHWMLIFGFNPVSVRSINFILMGVTIGLIWLSVYRLKLVTTAQARFMLIALLIGGAGTTFNYLIGRYDCTGIFLIAAAFLAYSIPLIWLRNLTLLSIGIFIPIAGVNLIPYGFIICSLLLIYLKKSFIREAISLSFGATIGLLFLYILYVTNGVAKVLLTSAGGHGLAGTIDKLSPDLGKAELAVKIKFVITHIPQILAIRLKNIPEWFLTDPSFISLLLLLTGLIIYTRHKKDFHIRSVASFGLIVSIAVPLILGILRDYPFYYSWMAYIPLSICVTSEISRLWGTHYRFTAVHFLVIAVITYACIPGLPIKLLTSFRDQSWQRNYTKVEQFIASNVSNKDKAYSDFEAYYPVKQTAEYVLLPTYRDMMSDKEKQEVSILVIMPENYKSATSLFEGKWYEAASLKEPEPYNLKIYRKSVSQSK